ncbi:MAG: DUF4340 domain-containing protein [Proteobacteria bacterium]|nr:DUF4340 domain-containing protein [Pseudomonadota bacterium]MCP4919152.1 DUF4340 domain-containing protein [Pseudomonadota bacterium]
MEDKQTRLMTVMAVVLVALVLVIRFVEPPSDEDEDGPELDALVELAVEDVERLHLTTGEGTLTAERTVGRWLLIEPTAARGSDQQLDALVESISRLKVEPGLEEADAAKYGLDAPRAVLNWVEVGGVEHRLELGLDSPVGFKSYVRLDGGPVQVANGHPSDTLTLPFEAFRDRTVYAVATSLIDAVAWRPAEGGGWAASRTDDGWWLEDGRRASGATIDGLTAGVDALQFETFYPELTDAEAGFAPPRGHLELTDATGTTSILFGELRAGGLLLKSPDGTVGSIGVWDGLTPTWAELVEPRLVPASPSRLSELELALDGKRSTWVRVADAWTRDGQPTDNVLPGQLVISLQADRSLALDAVVGNTGHVRAVSDGQTYEVIIGDAVEGGRLAHEAGGSPAMFVPSEVLDVIRSALEG